MGTVATQKVAVSGVRYPPEIKTWHKADMGLALVSRRHTKVNNYLRISLSMYNPLGTNRVNAQFWGLGALKQRLFADFRLFEDLRRATSVSHGYLPTILRCHGSSWFRVEAWRFCVDIESKWPDATEKN